MYVVTVLFTLEPGSLDVFLPLMQANAAQSRDLESGCHQFDVCTDPDRSDIIFLYEIYEDEAAFKTHLEMPHYLEFAEKTDAMIAQKEVKIYLRTEEAAV